MISGGTRGTLDVSEAAIAEALRRCGIDPSHSRFIDWRDRTYAHAVETFAAHIQQASDAAKEVLSRAHGVGMLEDRLRPTLAPFILSDPADPLVEAIEATDYATLSGIETEFAAELREQLRRRGLKIVETE